MTLGIMATDAEQRIDFVAMRSYKLKRIQAQLAEKGLGAILCFDPDNVRYATSTAIGEWSRDKFVRWCVVPREGEPYLFELGSAQEVKKELCPWIQGEHIFPGGGWLRGANSKGATGQAVTGTVARIKAVLDASKVADMAIGIDTTDLYILEGLKSAGLKIVNGWDVMWDARVIKCPQETDDHRNRGLACRWLL